MPRLEPLWLFMVCLLVGSTQAQPCCRLTGEFTELSTYACVQVWQQAVKGQEHSPELAAQQLRSGQFIPYASAARSLGEGWEKGQQLLSFCLWNDTSDALDIICKFSDIKGLWLVEENSLRSWPFVSHEADYDKLQLLTLPERQFFTYTLPPGKVATFLFTTNYPYKARDLFPEVSVIKAFEKAKSNRLKYVTLFNGVLFGIGLISILITLLLYIQIKDNALPAYALYIFVFLLYFWRDFEYMNLQFFSTIAHVPWLYTKSIFPAAICFSYILFIKNLLSIQEEFPGLYRILTWVSWLLPAFVIADYALIFLQKDWVYYVAPYGFGWLMGTVLLFINLYLWTSRDRMARFVVVGSLFLLLGGISVSVMALSIHEWVVRIAFVLELCCFSAAIGYRAKAMLSEKKRLENTLLESQLRHQMELETQLAIEKAVEAERIRSRVAQDIHDEAGAALTKISLAAHAALQIPQLSTSELRERLSKLAADARMTAGSLRDIVFAIKPDFDRFREMQAYLREQAREFWENLPPTVHFDFEKSPHDPIVPPDMRRELLLIFKEAQNNAAKHAAANNIWLTVKLLDNRTYLMEVRDDGRGMPTDKMSAHTQGLRGMRQRAERIGAELTVESAPGEGVRVRIMGKM